MELFRQLVHRQTNKQTDRQTLLVPKTENRKKKKGAGIIIAITR